MYPPPSKCTDIPKVVEIPTPICHTREIMRYLVDKTFQTKLTQGHYVKVKVTQLTQIIP